MTQIHARGHRMLQERFEMPRWTSARGEVDKCLSEDYKGNTCGSKEKQRSRADARFEARQKPEFEDEN